jgi:Dolichyl-phosphate-mannose-protein mannosyltransferase
VIAFDMIGAQDLARHHISNSVRRRSLIRLLLEGVAVTSVIAVIFILATGDYSVHTDVFFYLDWGQRIASGEAYTYGTRGPGLPLLIAATIRIFGQSYLAQIVLAHVIVTALCVSAWLLARRIFGPLAAMLTLALLLIQRSTIHIVGKVLLIDPLVSLLLILYLHATLSLFERPRPRYAVSAGLLFSCAYLVKETALLLAPVPLALVLCVGARRSFKVLFIVLIAAAVPMGAWHAYCRIIVGVEPEMLGAASVISANIAPTLARLASAQTMAEFGTRLWYEYRYEGGLILLINIIALLANLATKPNPARLPGEILLASSVFLLLPMVIMTTALDLNIRQNLMLIVIGCISAGATIDLSMRYAARSGLVSERIGAGIGLGTIVLIIAIQQFVFPFWTPPRDIMGLRRGILKESRVQDDGLKTHTIRMVVPRAVWELEYEGDFVGRVGGSFRVTLDKLMEAQKSAAGPILVSNNLRVLLAYAPTRIGELIRYDAVNNFYPMVANRALMEQYLRWFNDGSKAAFLFALHFDACLQDIVFTRHDGCILSFTKPRYVKQVFDREKPRYVLASDVLLNLVPWLEQIPGTLRLASAGEGTLRMVLLSIDPEAIAQAQVNPALQASALVALKHIGKRVPDAFARTRSDFLVEILGLSADEVERYLDGEGSIYIDDQPINVIERRNLKEALRILHIGDVSEAVRWLPVRLRLQTILPW